MLQLTEAGRALVRQALTKHVRSPEFRRQVRAGLAVSTGRVPVTLAGPQKAAKRRLTRERRDRLLGNVITIMKTRGWSKFEFEGVCRSGLRAGLCLEGWRWPEADAVAAEIVATALSWMGAVRPVWNEGQPEYLADDMVEHTRCVRCGLGIPEERLLHRPRTKFCSIECNRATVQERQRLSGERLSMLEWLAACSVKSQRTMTDLTRRCASCDTVFIAHEAEGKYCSKPCAHNGLTKPRVARACEHCQTIWTPLDRSQTPNRYCSRSCATSSRYIMSGG